LCNTEGTKRGRGHGRRDPENDNFLEKGDRKRTVRQCDIRRTPYVVEGKAFHLVRHENRRGGVKKNIVKKERVRKKRDGGLRLP